MNDPRINFAEQLKLAQRCVSDTDEFHREDAERLARLVLEFGAWVSEDELLADRLGVLKRTKHDQASSSVK